MTLTFADLVLELLKILGFVASILLVSSLMRTEYPRLIDWLLERRHTKWLRIQSTDWMDGCKYAEIIMQTNPYLKDMTEEQALLGMAGGNAEFDRGILAYFEHWEQQHALDYHA